MDTSVKIDRRGRLRFFGCQGPDDDEIAATDDPEPFEDVDTGWWEEADECPLALLEWDAMLGQAGSDFQ